MKAWTALWYKEWRQYRLAFYPLAAAIALFGALAVVGVMPSTAAALLMSIPLYVSAFLLPLLLAHSLGAERHRHTLYLLFSLPISKFQAIVSKYTVFLGMGTVLLILFTGFLYLAPATGNSMSADIEASPSTVLWLLFCGYYPSVFLPFLGMACLVEGAAHLFFRFRGVWSLAVILPVLLGFVLLAIPVVSALSGLGVYELSVGDDGFSITGFYFSAGFFVYGTLCGFVLAVIGTWIYSRNAEV